MPATCATTPSSLNKMIFCHHLESCLGVNIKLFFILARFFVQSVNWFWKFLRQVSPLYCALAIIKTASNADKFCCWSFALYRKESVAICVAVVIPRRTLVVALRQVPDRVWIVANIKQKLSFLKLLYCNLLPCTRKTDQQTKIRQHYFYFWEYHHTFPRESTTHSFSCHLPRVPNRKLYYCGIQRFRVPYLLFQE